MQPSVSCGEWDGTLQPAAAFLEEAAREPEVRKRRGQARADIDACGQRPFQRGAEVVMLAREDRKLVLSFGKAQKGSGMPRLGLIGGPGVIQSGSRGLAGGRQPPGGVLAFRGFCLR